MARQGRFRDHARRRRPAPRNADRARLDAAVERFIDRATPALGAERAGEAAAHLARLEDLPDIGDLTQLLGPDEPTGI